MLLKLQFESLKETKPGEYATRFVAGGVVTVLASLVAQHYGPVIGGLFLAFPAIFPAGISLVEKHKIEREAEEHKAGTISARGEAAVEATGASAGALGLAAFAVVLWKLPAHGLLATLVIACAAWAAVSWLAWWVRELL
jgi:hypothetical protein